MPLATIVALALPLVAVAPVPPERLAAVAAQLDDRPAGTVRLQCRVYARTRLVEGCTPVAAGETLTPAEFAARSQRRPTPGSLANSSHNLRAPSLRIQI